MKDKEEVTGRDKDEKKGKQEQVRKEVIEIAEKLIRKNRELFNGLKNK